MCFSNRMNPLVLTENLIDIIDQQSRESMQSSISIIDNEFKAKDIQIFNPARPTYFLSTDSDKKLNSILEEFKSMSTWSIESIFFVVDLTNGKYCKNAARVLQTLWDKELLLSFYVCSEPLSDTILIFTLNPYGPHAPQPWVKMETNDQLINRSTLFYQAYLNDDIICQNLTFDKTKVLEGYPVKAVETPKFKLNWTQGEAYGKEILKINPLNFKRRYFSTLFSLMNVTPIIYFDNDGYYVNGKVYGYLKSLVNGTHDIGMDTRQISAVSNKLIDTVQLYNENGLLIVIQKRKIEIHAENINNYYTIDIVTLSVFTLLITFTAILIYSKRFSDTVIDILQILLGRNIMTTLEPLSMRFVFVIATVVIFIVRPGLEQTLSALMSGPERYHVENLHDLHTLKYNIYTHTVFKHLIEDEKLWLGSEQKYLHYINTSSDFNCYHRILNDSNAACISSSITLLPAAIKYKNEIYTSGSQIFKTYSSYWTRRNWALKKRVNQITSRLTEFGIIEYWNRREHKYPMEKIKALKKIEESSELFQIDFDNLSFVNIFMAMMTILSILVFFIEICRRGGISFSQPRKKKLFLKQKIVIINKRIVILNKYIREP
ncbi:hypothetical protein KQX54_006166 [Cotesia glomerata]|uniref:Uncharacterized protein n=2 Tax=Cotesia glomerata TaxID=32391 RepID=A0AAV7J752_COTGL|nr:hypothetical protein KQX54_006166 [Cotesia glomerata]